ncbi:MAG: sulfotransferase family protein [Planctomycetota bacterium]
MDTIIVVTGLPRSGTSLAMQMLVAGGAEPLTDGDRQPDEDNPRGYYEFTPVKRLATGCDWIADARGRAVKVVSPLVPHLPVGELYRVILVERGLSEVLASQEKMLARSGVPAAPSAVLQKAFAGHVARCDDWLAETPNAETLRLRYTDVISDPRSAAESIAEFCSAGGGDALDAVAMAAAVDPKLYRNRKAAD